MSQIKMNSEDIADIKNALTIIQLNIDLIGHPQEAFHILRGRITEQVTRIDGLLPQVKFERKEENCETEH